MDPEDLQNIHSFLRHMVCDFYESKRNSYSDNFATKNPEMFNMLKSKLISLLKDQLVDESVYLANCIIDIYLANCIIDIKLYYRFISLRIIDVKLDYRCFLVLTTSVSCLYYKY